MSFESRDLMIDLIPSGKLNPFARPGLALCPEITSPDEGDDDEEDDELDCGTITSTAGEPAYAPREMDLALLRRQLRETLSLGDGPR